MPSSRGSSRPRDQTQVSCTAGGFFTIGAPRDAVPRVVLTRRGLPPAEARRAALQLLLQPWCPGVLARVSLAGTTPALIRHSRAKPNLSHIPSPLHTHAEIMAGSQQASLARQWLTNTLCSHPRRSLAVVEALGKGQGEMNPTRGKARHEDQEIDPGPPEGQPQSQAICPQGISLLITKQGSPHLSWHLPEIAGLRGG